MDIKRMRMAMHLLPEPGTEVVGGLLDEVDRLQAQRAAMLTVLEELDECAAYWSEYDVPLGLHDRIQSAIAKAKGEA